ncbi:hypothetical protein D3C79_1005750 [compost metagenome]
MIRVTRLVRFKRCRMEPFAWVMAGTAERSGRAAGRPQVEIESRWRPAFPVADQAEKKYPRREMVHLTAGRGISGLARIVLSHTRHG